MNFIDMLPYVEPIPEERRLVRQAKAGEADAFVALYDAYSDDVYRYIYFRVMNDVVAEAITSHVFRYAWDHLESYQKKRASFVTWVYNIVRNQILVYYSANMKIRAFHIGVLSVAADYSLNTEAQDWSNLEAWGNHLRLLVAYQQHKILQTTNLLIMRKYLDYLNPRRTIKPSPTFNAYTRAWLIRYLQFHPRRRKVSPLVEQVSLTYMSLNHSIRYYAARPTIAPLLQRIPSTYAGLTRALPIQSVRPRVASLLERMSATYASVRRALQPDAMEQRASALKERTSLAYARLSETLRQRIRQPRLSPLFQQMSLTYVLLITTLIASGTVQSQSAMPGDALYGWKRTSEQAWLALSPDPVGTDMILANRRLNEWIAVQHDPARSASALDDYLHTINTLNTKGDAQTSIRLMPMLMAHRDKLKHSGLSSTQLDNFLALGANPTLDFSASEVGATAVAVPPTTTAAAAAAAATTTEAADQPTATDVATEVQPTATEVATEVPPTATPVATEEPPTATPAPTEPPPTVTDVPTETAPPPTDVPTDVAPTDAPTDVPTDAVPTDTQPGQDSQAPAVSVDTPQPPLMPLP